MADTRGRSTGFDYLRIGLATAVVLWHAFTTSYGTPFAYSFLTSPLRPLVAPIVPAFFALSGFLVAGSLFRNSIITFVGLRAIRIYPALAVEVLLSAFILGPLLTTVPLTTYFQSPIFWKYMLNLAGYIHYQLPGLFIDNPVPNVVNGQLWTVPWELTCYVALTAFAVFRIVRFRLLFLLVTVFWMIGLVVVDVFMRHGSINQENGVTGYALVIPFLSAVAIFLYRNWLPWTQGLFVASAVVSIILFLVPGGDYLAGFPVAYATIYVGLLNPRKVSFLRGADYSYGLYIYHYAIQQALVFLMPGARHWYVVFPISLVLAGAFAAFSWHIVEKPVLGSRTWLLPPIDRAVGRLARLLTPLKESREVIWAMRPRSLQSEDVRRPET
jgi:peptidoglycan/LPS O-acetylase OafA/YrhL